MSATDKSLLEETAERLRLVLPAMSRHQVPVTPDNFAVWYHHISGDMPELSAAIEKLAAANTPFSESVNEKLYKEHLSLQSEHEKLEQIQQQLKMLIREASGSLNDTNSQTEHFHKVLTDLDSSAEKKDSDSLGLLKVVLNETQQMKNSLEQMRQEFDNKSSEMDLLRYELEQVRRQAITDPLTQLSNRTAFFDKLDEAITETYDSPTPLSVIMIDIDHFKNVNDTHGHLVGDKVIRFVATTLKKSVKGQDTAARYGGEEFAVLLPHTNIEGAVSLANGIRETIANTNLVRTGSRKPLGQITVSAGVSLYRSGEEPKDFLQRADDALYESKRNGRNRVTVGD